MSITRREVNEFYHGPVHIGSGLSADYVVAHGERQRQRGKQPSLSYGSEKNPQLALRNARDDLRTRELWDDGKGYGRVGIKLVGKGEITDHSNISWLKPSGLVGVVYVESDIPQVPLRSTDYAPNPDGTITITQPAN